MMYGRIISAIRSLRARPGESTGFVSRPDDLFLVSYPRSGNTWVRFLIANLIRYGCAPPADLCSIGQYVLDSHIAVQRKTLRDMSGERIIKSHSCYDPKYRKVIYLVRDGRDVMVSYYIYSRDRGEFKGDFMAFLKSGSIWPGPWDKHVNSWLDGQRRCEFMLVRYEDLLLDTVAELERMAVFAGLPHDRERLRWAVGCSEFPKLQKIERDSGHACSSDDYLFFRDGKAGCWKAYFDDAHKAEFKRRADKTLLRLGYVDDEKW